MTRFQTTFLALVLAQAAHSTEEYVGRLYEVFAPARFVSGLISPDLEHGFLIFNAAIVLFGFWCFLWQSAMAGRLRSRWQGCESPSSR
jgi:hypothetical protein